MSQGSFDRRNAQVLIEHVVFDDLKPMPGSPRRHPKEQLSLLTKSIRAFGFNVPVLIDAHNRIVAGHARVEVARKLGLARIPAVRLEHLDEPSLKAFMVADNRLSELAEWDEQKLDIILRDLSELDLTFDIEATGWSVAEIDLKIEGIDKEPETQEDAILEDRPSICQPGDMWQLGQHRLLCGNALEEVHWSRLIGDDRAALVVTDPPYNVEIGGNVSGLGKIRHREFAMAAGEMDEQQFASFLRTAMGLAYKFSIEGSVHYWAMDWRHIVELTTAARAIYERQLNLCVWTKTNAGMGSFYRSQHELFGVFAKAGAPTRNNVQLGRFGRSRSNVWSYPGANTFGRASAEGNLLALHPTVKPLALIGDVLLDASARGEVVVDPFLGSGTLLIAAEKLGRRARGIEFDPLYCDVAIRRWRNWTGDEAIRIDDGLTFSALEARGSSSHEC